MYIYIYIYIDGRWVDRDETDGRMRYGERARQGAVRNAMVYCTMLYHTILYYTML